VEIWQYRLRSRGFTVTWITGTLAGIFNTFVNPIALESIGWKYYFVFIVFLIAFLFVAYFVYPETRGRTLEQMVFIFDGQDAEVLASEEVEVVEEKGDNGKKGTRV
jgi:membrane protein implicated in regulation of membrane protease activity